MISKIFAPDYPRNEQGLVLFPSDIQERARLFPALDPTMHVAKANLLMVKALVEFVSEPGETILDPFAGVGTILVGATLGYDVICIELESPYVRIIESNIKLLDDATGAMQAIEADAFKLLPIPDFCDHMIFSPPYPMGLKKKGQMDKTSQDLGYSAATNYSAHPDNFTNLNTFLYHQRIERLYRKCLETVRAGGTMTIIIKDHIEKGIRQQQPDRTLRDCLRMGWELVARNRWLTKGGGYSAINRAHGLETVDEEDLLTFRKP